MIGVVFAIRAFLLVPSHHCLELAPKCFDVGKLVPNLDDGLEIPVEGVDLCQDTFKTLANGQHAPFAETHGTYTPYVSHQSRPSKLEFTRLVLSVAVRRRLSSHDGTGVRDVRELHEPSSLVVRKQERVWMLPGFFRRQLWLVSVLVLFPSQVLLAQ